MPDIVCNTSPIQYLHQLGVLHILPALAEYVIVPPAVAEELTVGRALGVNLPDLTALDWVVVRRPASELALPLVTDIGPGETQVLMLALESREAIVVLDDALARQPQIKARINVPGASIRGFVNHSWTAGFWTTKSGKNAKGLLCLDTRAALAV